MASGFYGNGIKGLINGSIDIDTDTIKVALTTSSYTPNRDTDQFFSTVTNEVSGSGYVAGGATLAGVTLTVDTVNKRVYLSATDVTWATSTITNAAYAVIYKSTGVAATSPLIGLVDFGGNKSTTGDTFYVQWAAAGSGGVLYFSY